MATWSEGYFTDTEYTDGYFKELSPLWLNLNLTLAGYAIPCAGGGANISPTKPICYLELAFGRGASITAHAVTVEGEYVGTDFNPTQVAMAQEYVVSDNITLYDDSFKELLERFSHTQPEFDYICLHGIFSWISAENRQIILEIIQRFLKVGGVVYNSYNCAPGWSSKMPSRELLKLHHDLHSSAQSNVESSVKESLGFLNNLLALNPAFAGSNAPANNTLMECLEKQSLTYIAHEYFNGNWDCFYFYQVAELMESAKCSFAASAVVMDQIDTCNFSEEALAFLGGIQNATFKEQLKDYFRNTQFRKDIFVKGARRISAKEKAHRLLNTQFMLTDSHKNFDYKVPCGRGEWNLNKESCDSIFKALEQDSYAPKTLQSIMESCKINLNDTIAVLLALIQKSLVLPAQEVSAEIAQKAKAFNHNTLSKNLNTDTSYWIAAPRVASAIAMSNVDKIILYAYLNEGKKESELINFALQTLKNKGQGIIKEGKTLSSDAENKAELKEIVKEFLAKIPLYKALGIVE